MSRFFDKKVKFSLSTRLGIKGSGCIAPHIPNLESIWRLVVTFTPRQLYFGKQPRHPLNRRLSGLQGLSGRFERENSFARTRIRTHGTLHYHCTFRDTNRLSADYKSAALSFELNIDICLCDVIEDASAEVTCVSVSIFWYINRVSKLSAGSFVRVAVQGLINPTKSPVCVYPVLIY